jgi:hypothetical protein
VATHGASPKRPICCIRRIMEVDASGSRVSGSRSPRTCEARGAAWYTRPASRVSATLPASVRVAENRAEDVRSHGSQLVGCPPHGGFAGVARVEQ